MPGAPLRQRAEVFQGHVEIPDQAPGDGQKSLTLRGQPHFSRGSLKQAKPDRILQLLDREGDRRLGSRETLRRELETVQVRNRDKRPQVFQGNAHLGQPVSSRIFAICSSLTATPSRMAAARLR